MTDMQNPKQAAPAAVAGPVMTRHRTKDGILHFLTKEQMAEEIIRLDAALAAAPAAQAAPQPAVQQGEEIDAAVKKAWDRFQAALDKNEPLPPPSIHAAAHYGTWLVREAHRHDEPKAGAFRNAARMLSVQEAEIRRLHAELIGAKPTAPVAQGDALTEIVGCIDAANAEGLDDALVNNTDARLADLVQRRLLPAFYVAIAAARTQAKEGGAA
ncbi:hypothetical protein [Diaphorobacter sp.]|uniref:hypothetical protein n=1 Tax=Diaphorobacter sp. TaxID=1934310 RepID=UPI00258B9BB7|nr:hypothetical protein [Diaphorobacter sp.]